MFTKEELPIILDYIRNALKHPYIRIYTGADYYSLRPETGTCVMFDSVLVINDERCVFLPIGAITIIESSMEEEEEEEEE